jgi:hypothetical protein
MRPSSPGFLITSILDGEDDREQRRKTQFEYAADPAGTFHRLAEVGLSRGNPMREGTTFSRTSIPESGVRVAFEPVTRGPRTDEVLKYDSELNLQRPDEVELKTWQDRYAQDAKEMVAAYEKDPKKSEYPKLSPQDGR